MTNDASHSIVLLFSESSLIDKKAEMKTTKKYWEKLLAIV
jgi:hypothetical protein